MGMTGALKLRQIVENAERIVAIELMCAAQGLEFRKSAQAAGRWSALTRRCGRLCRGWSRTGCWRRILRRWRRPFGLEHSSPGAIRLRFVCKNRPKLLWLPMAPFLLCGSLRIT
jgi:hypothetical protein